MKMKTLITLTAALALGAASVLPATAGIIQLEATLDEAQANAGAGTGSPATGSATMTLDDVTNLFSWEISWSALLGDLTVAHFHGPAGPGVNAGVEVDFLTIAPGNPSVGSTVISAEQATDLLAGLWYINVHSTEFPGGEIRGQVTLSSDVPAPATIALFGLGLAGLGWSRRKAA